MPDELLTPGSPYWEKCARHTNLQTARFVGHLFLCDDCKRVLQEQSLNGRPPIFEGLQVHGYCGLCNKEGDPKLRQWFIDPMCLNVVLSYAKGNAASAHVHRYWNEVVKPRISDLEIEEMDPVRVEAYVMRTRSQKVKAEIVTELDFKVTKAGKPVFFIELKAGPTGIDQMREFQLDVGDFNDIVAAYGRQCLPVYVFHVQINDEYMPPTRRSVARGLWWTDIFTLEDSRKAIRARRGEDKRAGYYKPEAFKSADAFLEELESGRYEELAETCKTRQLKVIE